VKARARRVDGLGLDEEALLDEVLTQGRRIGAIGDEEAVAFPDLGEKLLVTGLELGDELVAGTLGAADQDRGPAALGRLDELLLGHATTVPADPADLEAGVALEVAHEPEGLVQIAVPVELTVGTVLNDQDGAHVRVEAGAPVVQDQSRLLDEPQVAGARGRTQCDAAAVGPGDVTREVGDHGIQVAIAVGLPRAAGPDHAGVASEGLLEVLHHGGLVLELHALATAGNADRHLVGGGSCQKREADGEGFLPVHDQQARLVTRGGDVPGLSVHQFSLHMGFYACLSRRSFCGGSPSKKARWSRSDVALRSQTRTLGWAVRNASSCA